MPTKNLEKCLFQSGLWVVGRITQGTDYLESLASDNIKSRFVSGEITQITENGVITNNGKGEYPVEIAEVPICATGFDTTFKPRFLLVGSTEQRLGQI